MEIDQLLVMDAVKNTGAESSSEGAGAINAGESNAFIGGKAALLVYAAPSPSLMTPSGGYSFSWTGFMGAGALGQRIKRFRMEHLESDRIEIQMAYTQKIIAPEAGTFFTSIIA